MTTIEVTMIIKLKRKFDANFYGYLNDAGEDMRSVLWEYKYNKFFGRAELDVVLQELVRRLFPDLSLYWIDSIGLPDTKLSTAKVRWYKSRAKEGDFVIHFKYRNGIIVLFFKKEIDIKSGSYNYVLLSDINQDSDFSFFKNSICPHFFVDWAQSDRNVSYITTENDGPFKYIWHTYREDSLFHHIYQNLVLNRKDEYLMKLTRKSQLDIFK